MLRQDKDGVSTIRQLWCSSPGSIGVDNQTVPLHRTVLPAQMSSQTEISSLKVAIATVAGSVVPILMWMKSARPHSVVLVLVCSLPETFQCCHEMFPGDESFKYLLHQLSVVRYWPWT